MSTQPALPAPSGVTSNIQNPTDVIRTVNFVTQGLTIGFVSLVVTLHLISKIVVFRRVFRYEDYAVYTAWALMIGYCACGISLSIYGGGYNQWDVSVTMVTSFFKTSYVATVFYMPMTLFVKLSLLLIISRVFTPYKQTSRAIYAFTVLVTAYYVAGWLVKIFACWPISAYWKGQTNKCLDQRSIIIADAITSTTTDLIILVVPIPLTWSLEIPRAKKLRVAGMLSAGGLATAFSIYRLALIISDGDSPNYTMLFVRVVLSGNAEVGIGLICACLPAVSRLVVTQQWTTPHASKYTSGPGHHTSDSGNRWSKSEVYVLSQSSAKKRAANDNIGVESDQTELIDDQQQHMDDQHIYRSVDYSVRPAGSSDCGDADFARHVS